MQSRRYTDKNGVDRLVWELLANKVEFMGDKPAADKASVTEQATANDVAGAAQTAADTSAADDYPF